ncbi:hypothetical protein CI109_104463 [Kwoniella shandongensis]|uniref:TauD/TfdA-like domain-containing protein n=1 Tax=Kwoniella shandongensis TaxID=1734106 RepID=A0A5M6BRY6_9TREE|nr:uncharacterized protein CI109_007313 [Kwoniella shandongensis]KAA5524365.1 hypothetical protein CI109_007313 [Kwoniella shandongensis]
MAAAVATPVSALVNQFTVLDLYGKPQTAAKRKFTEEEKRKKIYETAYEPNLEWWTSNQAAYNKPESDPLPAGYPDQVNPSSLWDGHKLINEPEKWLYRFTREDIDLLHKAYDHFVSLKLHNNEIKQATFPIPEGSALRKALAHAAEEIGTGLGFRVLRGLPVDDWDRKKQIAIFAGISSYISDKRIKQGTQNIVHLRDITDLPEDKRPAITVKGQTSGNQVFHNDGSTGIVGLITLNVAETGGLSQLSSVAQTYNELANTRRDILREFAKDDWKNKQYPDGKRLFHAHNGNVISNYSRRPYFSFYEADNDLPPLSEEKHLALDAVHFTAEKFSLDLNLEKGDLEYFNNLTVFHARTSSRDSEKNHRHLIRIWLDHKDVNLPEHLAELYSRQNAGTADDWPLEAWESTDPYTKIGDAKLDVLDK